MRLKQYPYLFILMVFTMLFVFGCRSRSEETPDAYPVPVATVSKISITPGPEMLSQNDALYGYEGVSLGFSSELASNVFGTKQPAYAGFGLFYTSSGDIRPQMPDYIELMMQTSTFPARVGVQPIRTTDNQAYTTFAPEEIQRISTIENDVRNQLGAADVSPTPPKLTYIQFNNGIGRRYLAFKPSAQSFANENLYYVFEGVTDNGRYLTFFEYPISTPFLDGPTTDATLETITSQLDDLPTETFTPDLTLLDAVATSFEINPTDSFTFAATSGSAQPGNLVVTLGDVAGDIPPEVYAINQETNQQFTSILSTGLGLKQVTLNVPAGDYQVFAHIPGDVNGTFLGYWDVSDGQLSTVTVNTNETNSDPILTLADDPCTQNLPETPDGKYPATDTEPFQNLSGCLPAVGADDGSGNLHTVRAGDTLLSISRLYGIDWQRIARMNGLTEPYLLQPGQELIIPAP
jgi:nucleoid-associated protein YgaU